MTTQNIESELSYAYLHAVASRAGFSCEYRNRHLDGAGVDATITSDEKLFAPDSKLRLVSVDVQLKATYKILPETAARFSYSLEIAHYDKLRMTNRALPLILVVLRLPENPEEWLTIDGNSLVSRRCANWVSLYNAPPSANQATHTVYVPTANVLSPAGLTALMTRYSRQENISYETE